MKFCFLNAYHDLNVNQFQFHPTEQAIGARLFDGMRALYSEGRKRNYTVYCAENSSALASADALIFIDWDDENPLCKIAMSLRKPKIFIQSELPSHLRLPILGKEILFFSYSETNFCHKIYPFNYSVNISERPQSDIAVRDKFITMMATNYHKSFPGELYSLRANLARAAQDYFDDQFHLYGRNWNSLGLKSNGFSENKAQVLKRSVFSICLENSHLHPGYVTEKLLETVFYGAIPIYYCTGHSRRKVPHGVFLNVADFKSTEALFDHLRRMPDSQIIEMRGRGSEWMASENFHIFDSHFNSNFFWETLDNKISAY